MFKKKKSKRPDVQVLSCMSLNDSQSRATLGMENRKNENFHYNKLEIINRENHENDNYNRNAIVNTITNIYTNRQPEDNSKRTENHIIPKHQVLDTATLATKPTETRRAFYGRKHMNEILNTPFEDDFQPKHQDGPDIVLPATKYTSIYPDEPVKLRIGFTPKNSIKPKSLITIFDETRRRFPLKVAMSVKRNDEWVHWNYAQYWDEVCIVAKAFLKLGLKRYHSAAMLGFNAPEWLLSHWGAMFAGGIPTGLYMTNKPEACKYVLQHSRANIAVVENEEQLKKILEVRDSLPHLKTIIQYTGTPTHEDVFSWEDVMAIGRTVPDECLQARLKSLAINECCVFVYTSGTTGNPKSVMISHDNINYILTMFKSMQDGLIRAGLLLENQEIRLVSFLPLNHLAAQIQDIYCVISTGDRLVFAPPNALKGALLETLQEVQPVIFASVPRFWEKIKERVEDKIETLNFVKRNLIKWAMHSAYLYTESQLMGTPPPKSYVLARPLINKMRALMGFKEAVYVAVGGAPVSIHLQKFFMGLNITLTAGYGMTECTGVHVVGEIWDFQFESIGKVPPDHELKIDNPSIDGTGEICLKGRNICMGYMRDKKSTEETFKEDGWLHSGDIGKIAHDGFLHVTGRLKELIITSGGENIAPAPIEEEVKIQLPCVSNAIVIGDRRKFLIMLLTLKTTLDMENMMYLDELESTAVNWFASVGVHVKTVQAVLQSFDIRITNAIQSGIERANERAISRACHIQKWRILPKEFSVLDGDLSPTMKMKRNVIAEKYKDLIDELYK